MAVKRETNDFLRLWQLTSGGESVPLVHDELLRRLHLMDPERDAGDILSLLRGEGLVEATVYGAYVLTAKGAGIRNTLPAPVFTPVRDARKSDPEEWKPFRRLLGYYIDCVRQEKANELLYADQNNRDFIIPILPVGWLPPLERGGRRDVAVRIRGGGQAAFRARMVIHSEEDEEIYIGYPVSMFRVDNGGAAISPVGLIPAELTSFCETELRFSLHLDEARINQTWIDFNIRRERKNAFVNSLYRLSEAGRAQGLIDYRKALEVIQAEIGGKQGVTIDPDRMGAILPDLPEGGLRRGARVFNFPVLFAGQPLRYSGTLKRELKHIRDEVSDEELDQTALAYVFRKHCFPSRPHPDLTPIPFAPMNAEQAAAVKDALTLPVSKVSGPPGTGKSHAAMQMIANLVYYGKSVLFTSKNHRAVLAISGNAERLKVSGHSPDLITFCFNEDRTAANPWYRQDLNALIGRGISTARELAPSCQDELCGAIGKYRRAEAKICEREEFLREIEEAYSRYADACRSLRALLDIDFDILGPDGREETLRHLACLYDRRESRFSFRSIAAFCRWFRWHLGGGKRKCAEACEALRKTCPDILKDYEGAYGELREKVRLFRKESRVRDARWRELERIRGEWARKNGGEETPDLREAQNRLQEALDVFPKCAREALALALSRKIAGLAESPETLRFLQGVMAVLRDAGSPYFFTRRHRDILRQARDGFRTFSAYCPAWATTLLSLTKASPCLPGLFDKVIIDEAAQCEAAPIIPALFRAKTVTVIGDDRQLPPVIDLRKERNAYLKEVHGLNDAIEFQRFDYLSCTAYNLTETKLVMLKEHFRCDPEIASYCNERFYEGRLRFPGQRGGQERKPHFPSFMGYRAAVVWEDVKDSWKGEREKVREILNRLINNGYDGTVGIITPFRHCAADLSERLHGEIAKLQDNEITVGTVHSFQGGERDLIIFALGYTSELTGGQGWFITDETNRYIFNVAVSRAKACLIAVGDRERCGNSGSPDLETLAAFPRQTRERPLEESFESPYEKLLYNALLRAGINTVPQYPIAGRRLDLAYLSDTLNLDIEVDGVRYHTNREGERAVADQYRDLQIRSCGWEVCRFWVYELHDDVDACVERVQEMISAANRRRSRGGGFPEG